jgi:hypothetical protein
MYQILNLLILTVKLGENHPLKTQFIINKNKPTWKQTNLERAL